MVWGLRCQREKENNNNQLNKAKVDTSLQERNKQRCQSESCHLVTAAPTDFVHCDSCNQGKSKHFAASEIPAREPSALAKPRLPSTELGRRRRQALERF